MPLKYVARALMNVNFYQKFAVFTQSAAVWPRAAPLKQLRWMKRNPRIYPEHGRLQGNLFSPKLPFKKKKFSGMSSVCCWSALHCTTNCCCCCCCSSRSPNVLFDPDTSIWLMLRRTDWLSSLNRVGGVPLLRSMFCGYLAVMLRQFHIRTAFKGRFLADGRNEFILAT